MSGRGGIYTGPGGEQLHGDGRPVGRPYSSFAAPAGCAALVDESIGVLTECCQLMDGWHNDGTCWSEWDEGVRKRASELLKRFYDLKQHNAALSGTKEKL